MTGPRTPDPASAPARDAARLAGLLARVADGDRAALRELYDRTAPKLFGVILRIQPDRSLAEDVLQDVFLRVWQAAGRYAPEAGGALSWLCAIARNRAIDGIRGRGEVRAAMGEDTEERSVDLHAVEQALTDRGALRVCLGRLEAVHADCIVLAYCAGWSREELAQRHDRPVNTIKTWLHRALATLKGCLEAAP